MKISKLLVLIVLCAVMAGCAPKKGTAAQGDSSKCHCESCAAGKECSCASGSGCSHGSNGCCSGKSDSEKGCSQSEGKCSHGEGKGKCPHMEEHAKDKKGGCFGAKPGCGCGQCKKSQ